MSGYTCKGSVRGSCGLEHATLAEAHRCCEADRAACTSPPDSLTRTYSDRYVCRLDGRNLSDAEMDALDELESEAES